MAQMFAFNDLDVPKMHGLAQRIAALSNCVQLCNISWTQDARDEGYKIINIEDSWRVPGAICVFLASFDSTQDLYEQFAAVSKLPRLGAQVLKIIMPFFPSLTLRAEGGERGQGRIGEIPLSRTLARLLSAIPNAKAGPTELVIFDIHHLQERFYFDDNTVPRLETSMHLLTAKLDQLIEQHMHHTIIRAGDVRAAAASPAAAAAAQASNAALYPWDDVSQEEVLRLQSLGQLSTEEATRLRNIKVARRKTDPEAPMIAFSDEKTAKRFGRVFPGFPQVICTRMLKEDSKKMNEQQMIVLEGNPKGKTCVLIDDVIITGATMIQCAQLLRQEGAKAIWVYVTHGQFSQESWKHFITPLFERVIVTDSCPTMAEKLAKIGPPFEIMSLAPLIRPLIEEEAVLSVVMAQSKSNHTDLREIRSRL